MGIIPSSAGAMQQTVSVQDSGTACSAAGTCAVFAFGSAPSLTVQITGTYSGTLTFEATVDGQSWYGISATKLSDGTTVATTTGTGLFAFTNTGLAAIRARGTTINSGAAACMAGAGVW